MGSAGGGPPGQPGQITAAFAFGFALGLLVRFPGLGLRPGLRSFLSFLVGSRPRGDLFLGLLFLSLWEPVDRLDRLLRRDPPDPDTWDERLESRLVLLPFPPCLRRVRREGERSPPGFVAAATGFGFT